MSARISAQQPPPPHSRLLHPALHSNRALLCRGEGAAGRQGAACFLGRLHARHWLLWLARELCWDHVSSTGARLALKHPPVLAGWRTARSAWTLLSPPRRSRPARCGLRAGAARLACLLILAVTPALCASGGAGVSDCSACAGPAVLLQGTKTVWVGQLPEGTTEEKLREIFEQFGEVRQALASPRWWGRTWPSWGLLYTSGYCRLSSTAICSWDGGNRRLCS